MVGDHAGLLGPRSHRPPHSGNGRSNWTGNWRMRGRAFWSTLGAMSALASKEFPLVLGLDTFGDSPAP
jgi:hypothetical protein